MLFRRFVTGQHHSWIVALASLIVSAGFAGAAPNVVPQKDPMDWPNWRGPEQNRVSRETGLIDKWNPETKENVLWFCPEAAGISSPIVMNGKVYTQVRYKPDTKEEQEEVHLSRRQHGKTVMGKPLERLPFRRAGGAHWLEQRGGRSQNRKDFCPGSQRLL